MTVERAWLAALPKAELHVHLDGCLRPATMLELGRAARVSLPADTPDTLAAAMLVRDAGSLEAYLDRYRYTAAVMQTGEALRRVAHEFVLDVFAENVRYVEVRFCPALHTPALTPAQAVEAVLAGLAAGERETGCRARLIISALRTLSPAISDDLARVAVEYRHAGVVAFDLAGAEAGYPARLHASAFRYARDHGLPCTCHAGEADGSHSVWQALRECGVQRIGHGTRIGEDPELEAHVIDREIPLEVCLSSNVHTRAVVEIGEHPIRRYFDRGAIVTLNTDGRMIDGVSLTDEYALAMRVFGFTRDELQRIVLNGFRAAFLDPADRDALAAEAVNAFGID